MTAFARAGVNAHATDRDSSTTGEPAACRHFRRVVIAAPQRRHGPSPHSPARVEGTGEVGCSWRWVSPTSDIGASSLIAASVQEVAASGSSTEFRSVSPLFLSVDRRCAHRGGAVGPWSRTYSVRRCVDDGGRQRDRVRAVFVHDDGATNIGVSRRARPARASSPPASRLPAVCRTGCRDATPRRQRRERPPVGGFRATSTASNGFEHAACYRSQPPWAH